MRGRWIKGTNMMSSRGCVYDCSYCASKVMFGRAVRFISPKRVVDEIEHLVKDYGMKAITFSDLIRGEIRFDTALLFRSSS